MVQADWLNTSHVTCNINTYYRLLGLGNIRVLEDCSDSVLRYETRGNKSYSYLLQQSLFAYVNDEKWLVQYTETETTVNTYCNTTELTEGVDE